MSRPRVLLIAEAANPEWVSVPLVGWSIAQALREVADVHLVTQLRNKDAILRAGLVEGRDFTAIDSEALARPLWKMGRWLRMGEGKGWTTLQAINALAYPYFERKVWRQFGEAIEQGAYDIVHRITPLSPTSHGPLAKRLAKCGVPFVLGPLNGGVPWPREFNAERHAEKEYLSYLRGAYRMLPWRRATLSHADAILAGSYHTASEVPDKHRDKVIWLPENAIDPTRFAAPPERTSNTPSDGPLRACFIGRMVPYKGPDMLIEAAMPLLKEGIMSLDMIGDGPLLPELQAQVAQGDVAHAVRFHGWVEHEDVAKIAGQNTLLAFPSIREFGGGAVLEAMAMGLAPLIVDYAGPAELVQDDTGYKLPLGTREEIVAGLRGALRRLAARPAEVRATGCRARTVVLEHFTWAAKAGKIAQIYDWVLNKELPRPDFSLVPPDVVHPPQIEQQDAPQPSSHAVP